MRYYLPYQEYISGSKAIGYIRVDVFNPKHWVGAHTIRCARGEILWYHTHMGGAKYFHDDEAAKIALDMTLRKLGHYIIEPEEVERFRKLVILA